MPLILKINNNNNNNNNNNFKIVFLRIYKCACVEAGFSQIQSHMYITYGSYIQFPKCYFYIHFYTLAMYLSCDNAELYKFDGSFNTSTVCYN